MNNLSSESLMRARLKRSAQLGSSDAGQVAFGVETLDARLEGGLAKAALHEIYAEAALDTASAAAFALLLALRASKGKPVLWVREEASRRQGRPYGHGLAELGIAPDRLILVEAPDIIAALRAGADITRCSAVGAVIIELTGKAHVFDLTASRRLALAAGQSGVMTLVLRINAEPTPSAAHTRWRVASAPSTPLSANAPGAPAFEVKLLRHRGGIAGIDARLEWNRDRQSFDHAPLSGGVPAIVASGARQTVERRAA
jgi:protein ImuA